MNLWFEAKNGYGTGGGHLYPIPRSLSLMSLEKRRLRTTLRVRRQALSAPARRDAAARLARFAPRALRGARYIGAYLPHGSELDPRPLMRALRRAGCIVCVPAVARRAAGPLAFRIVRAPFVTNDHGIREPRWGARIPPWRLDAVLLPLVGFDARGRRLGQGGGHYDRTFAARFRWRRRPRLIGIGFECQRVAQLPKEGHDVHLHAVLTEKRVYKVRRPV